MIQNSIAEKAEKTGAEIVNWHPLNFFLHTSEEDKKLDLSRPLQDQIKHYSPGGLEVRQFKNKPNTFFNINNHRKVFPEGVKAKPLLDYSILKHYVVRGPQQFIHKSGTGTQGVGESQKKVQKIYFDQINHFGKQVRIYDGSFHEFEQGKRPSFIIQYLSWHKYRIVDWGIFSWIKKLFIRG